MAQIDIIKDSKMTGIYLSEHGKTLASGIFGYAGQDASFMFQAKAGYIRDIEQMPHFAQPSLERFSALYVQSNLGKSFSSS